MKYGNGILWCHALTDEHMWMGQTHDTGIQVHRLCYKKESNHEHYKNFWQFCAGKICIMGIKLKPQERLRQNLIGDLH